MNQNYDNLVHDPVRALPERFNFGEIRVRPFRFTTIRRISDLFTTVIRAWNFTNPLVLAQLAIAESEVIFAFAFLYSVIGAWFGLPFTGMIFFLWISGCIGILLTAVVRENFENIKGFLFGCVQLCFHGFVQPTARVVNETMENINNVVTGIGSSSDLSLSSVVGELQKHPLGMSCALRNVASVSDWNEFARHIIVLGSLAGLETSVINTLLKKVFSARQANPAGTNHALNDVLKNMKSFDVKRLTGLAALGTSVVGYQVGSSDHLKFLRDAVANQAAIEKAWDLVEEALNSLGVISTGKWAYLEELQRKYDSLEPEFKYFLQVLSVTPSDLCRPTIYARYLRFRKGMEELDKTCRMNSCPDIKNSKIFMSLQTLVSKALTWDAQVSQVRSTHGVRPVPVGIVLQGPSQLGKSMLAAELVNRVKRILHSKYNEDPEKYASFCMANEWSTWNMQVRDEYDEGYGGNEITYSDDCFADKEHKDHPMWLTFISSACVGTVQARLDQKGSPFVSRIVVASCNNLPRTSTTINNIEALWRRFPFTISVRLRDGASRKAITDDYDPDFSHLEFHVESMENHCQLNPGNCKWIEGGAASCTARSKTLDQLAVEIANACVANDMKFVSQMHALGTAHSDDTLSDVADGLSSVPSFSTVGSDDTLDEAREYIEEALTMPVVKDWSDVIFTSLARKLPSQMNLEHAFADLIAMRGLNAVDTYRYLMGCARQAQNLDAETRQELTRLAATPLFCLGINGDTYLVWHRINEGITFVRFCVGDKPELDHVDDFLSHLQEAGSKPFGEAQVLVWTSDSHLLRLAATRFCDVFTDQALRWHLSIEEGRRWRMDMLVSRSVVSFRRLNEHFEAFTETGLLRDIPERVWNEWIKKPLNDLIEKISEFFVSTKDFIFWCLTKLAEILNIGVSEVLVYWFDAVAAGTTVVLGVTIVPIVIALIVGMYRWLTSDPEGTAEKTRYNDEDKQRKRSARTHRRNVMRTRAGAKQEGEVPINYYKSDEECPFCKEAWSYEDPEGDDSVEPEGWLTYDHPKDENGIENTSQWFYRKPKYPYPRTKKHLMAVSDALWYYNQPKHVHDVFFERVKDTEAEYDQYCFRLNPLEVPCVFKEEFLIARELLGKEFDSKGTIQRNWGPESGGSVPHSHIHCFDDGEKVADIRAFYCDLASRKKGSDRYVVLEFGTPDLEKDCDSLIARLSAMSAAANHPSFVFKCTIDGNRASGSFVIPTSQHQGSRKNIEAVADLKKAVNVSPDKVESCLQQLGVNLGSKQGMDDGATALLRSIIEKNQYVVIRVNLTANGQLDSTLRGAGGGALASGRYLVCPAHYGKLGDWFAVYHLGITPWDRMQMGEFWFAQMVNSNSVSDVAILETLDPTKISSYPSFLRENRGVIRWVANEARRPFCARDLSQYMLDENEHDIPKGTNVAVWMPRAGLPYTGVVESHKATRFYDVEEKETVNRSYVVITGGSTNQGLSQKGDCGGPAVLLDPSRSKKLFGMHAWGGKDYTGIAYFSKDEYLDLVARRITLGTAQSDAVEILISSTENHFDTPSIEASYGKAQIPQWPAITWSDHQPNKSIITEGCVGSDTPLGPCSKPVGIITERHVAYVDNGKSLYRKSPFYGCFEIRLIPPVLTVYDERRKLPIPSNLAGEETMLHANFILAEELPTLNKDILNRVVSDFINYWSTVLAGTPIGSPDDLDVVLAEGMNGPPAALNLHGMVIHKGSGLPWTLNPKTAKKDRMIGLDEETGRRFFLDTPEGDTLKELCKLKLREAQKAKRVLSFCASKLKTNQLLKISNVEKGKTRVFNSSAVESVICTNALWVRLKEQILQHSDEFHVSMGMDVHSADWHMLWSRLEKHPHIFDLDYGNFDKRLHSVMLRAAYFALDRIIQNVDPDVWSTARLTLAEDDISAIMVDNTSVWQKEHGNPSGCAMTTFINCVCNSFNKYYAWLMLVDKPFDVFLENVEWSDFGDDAIQSVSEEYFPLYNRKTIIDCLKETGQEVTPASKVEGSCDPDSPIGEVTFLKCFTRKFGHFHVAALDQKSLEGQFGWTKLQDHDVVDWAEVVRNSLLYAVAHGEEYWNSFSGALSKRLQSSRFPAYLRENLAPIVVGNYGVWERRLLDMVTSMATIGSPQYDDGSDAIREDIDKNGKTLYSWLYSLDVPEMSTKIGQLQTQLTTLGQTVQGISLAVDDLKTFRDTVSNTIDEIQKLVDALKDIPKEVESLTSRVTQVEASITSTNNVITELSAIVEQHKLDIGRLTGEQDFHTQEIAALTKRTTDLESWKVDASNHIEGLMELTSNYHEIEKRISDNRGWIDQMWNMATLDNPLDCLNYLRADMNYHKVQSGAPVGMSGFGPTMHFSDSFNGYFTTLAYTIGFQAGKEGSAPKTNIESGDHVTFRS